MQEKIIEVLEKVVSDLTDEKVEIVLSVPEMSSHGDYSSNIALILSKKLGKSPREIAESLALEIRNLKLEIIDHVDVAGPGFINFFLSVSALQENLKTISIKKDEFGNSSHLKNKKVMLEFGDPNPFKEFHIGHLYTVTIGEALSRLSESQGAEVWRVCYQGDVGLHVAKAIYGIKQKGGLESLKDTSIEERAKFLGECYALGSTAYEDENIKQEINQLNKKIYDRSDEEINSLYDLGRQWSLDYFDIIYKRLGTSYKKHYFESVVGKIGLEFVRDHIGTVFETDNGAVIFPGKKYGLHNRVFINSLGLPTYEAKELGLAPTKYHDFPYNESIIITGNEINEYFKVLLKALSLISPELSEKTRHIGHGMVRLPEGKMSSRTGNIITGEWLLDTAKEKIKESYPEMDAKTLEQVAVAAVKYALLKSNIGSDTAFSFSESINLDGNSGPYLQYTYARTQSILAKAGVTKPYPLNPNPLEQEEENLLRKLVHFPEVVAQAAERLAPSTVCTYLFELAQDFNLFYQKVQILKSEEQARKFRLALVSATGYVIKNGLFLLGIEAPEKM